MMKDLKAEFESIGSEDGMAQFVRKLGLSRTAGGGRTSTYSGEPWGLAIEIREMWSDPSSVYSPQPDKHEAILLLAGTQIASIRFVGAS